MNDENQQGSERIAIVGMACRFPGAESVDAFWRNLRDGVESITRFSDEELLAAGIPAAVLARPDYVRASGALEGADRFDAEFFEFTPRDAELTDPQQRLFLEQAWAALEDAGCDPSTCAGPIGVFAGCNMNSYLLHNVAAAGGRGVDVLTNRIRSDSNFLSTLVSYKLNLRGPSFTVGTACSTSLVALHLAAQSLLDFQCDVALAGGVSVNVPLVGGYSARDGLFSPDGRCRAFDARGQGTVAGNGVGVVVLKRLGDALADGDRIHAVVLGSAVNNDGAQKVGFTAPSVEGQIEVVAMAHAVAEVEPESVTYVEAHGTGTSLGDPIEVAALTRAFGGDERGYCAIGSVKTNIGHLDAAGGVAGVIKTVLALRHGEIPPSLHFESPNPAIDFAGSPFFVADRLRPWERRGGFPRRAGVSAMGVGGTNAHVVLEEAPAPALATEAAAEETLVLSARTPLALERLSAALAGHLEAHPELRLADVAFTLQRGRRAFAHRRALAARDTAQAAAMLRARRAPEVATLEASATEPGVVFLFPGSGTERPGMARGLYDGEPRFRAALDRCFELLRARWDMDLRAALYGGRPELLRHAAYADAAVFSVGWALAESWRALGVEPRAVVGHGLGEYAAACAAGVFSLEDALGLVVRRGRLVEALPEAAARVVTLDVERVRAMVGELAEAGHGVWVAAVNAAHSSVVSGTAAALDVLAARVRAEGWVSRPLPVRRPLHSGALAGVRDAFAAAVSAAARRAPGVPLASGLTGDWLRPDRAQSVEHWTDHLASPVLFGRCLERVRTGTVEPVLLEMGAGALCGWARLSGAPRAAASLEADAGEAAVPRALGYLWAAGVRVDWTRRPRGDRRRVSLPGHPMERRRYWIDAAAEAAAERASEGRRPASSRVFAPEWRQSAAPRRPGAGELAGRRVVAFAGPAGAALLERLGGLGAEVVRVEPGTAYREDGSGFAVRPGEREDFARLGAALRGGGAPVHTLHLWSLEGESADPAPGARALLHWLDAAAAAGLLAEGASVSVATAEAQAVLGPELRHSARALLVGGVRGAAEERPGLHCRAVDVEAGAVPVEPLLAEAAEAMRSGPGSVEAAYRGRRRWTARFAEVPAPSAPSAPSLPGRLRAGGAYLVTGGLSGTGLLLARHLAERAGARLALVEPVGSGAGDGCTACPVCASGSAVCARDAALAELKGLGAAEVAVLHADVADAAALGAALEQAGARFGALHGVAHAAGAGASEGLAALVGGALALDEALGDAPLDFLLLCRPLEDSADPRCAAERRAGGALLDALAAERHYGRGLPTVSLAWGADDAAPGEAAAALDRVLALEEHAQLAVTPRDLAAAVEPTAVPVEARAEAGQGRHPRPPVATPFVAPRNELESTLTGLFQRELGIEAIGVDDDFFEMGGDSLLAMQVMTAVNAEFGLQVPLRAVFEAPTPARLAQVVVSHQAEGIDEELLAAVLAEL